MIHYAAFHAALQESLESLLVPLPALSLAFQILVRKTSQVEASPVSHLGYVVHFLLPSTSSSSSQAIEPNTSLRALSALPCAIRCLLTVVGIFSTCHLVRCYWGSFHDLLVTIPCDTNCMR